MVLFTTSTTYIFILGILALVGNEMAAITTAEPLKVFILAGQSNMKGQASLNHMSLILRDPSVSVAEKERYKKYILPNGTFTTKPNVMVEVNGRGQSVLTPGLGKTPDFFGPELEFGYLVGDMFDRVLLIKASWGGTSLAVDWRPPFAGLPEFDYLADLTTTTKACTDQCYGARYRDMMRIVNTTLTSLRETEYQLTAFLWFQGFSDSLDHRKVSEYGANLIALVAQVRHDLGAPDLPVLVGELGMHGPTIPERLPNPIAMREIQAVTVDSIDNAELILTSPYVSEKLSKFVEGQVQLRLGRSYYDGQHHYYGKADIMVQIGCKFAEPFLPNPSTQPSISPTVSLQPSTSPSFSPSYFPTRTSRPTVFPSRSPRPTLTEQPSPVPTFNACDDNLFQTFFVEQTGKQENCLWLQGRPEYHGDLCRVDREAYDICEETCGKCKDFCEEDATASFRMDDGTIRNCLWLSLRSHFQDMLCLSDHPAWTLCPETCNNPICEKDRLEVCDDDNSGVFYVDFLGKNENCNWLRNRPEFGGQLCVPEHDAFRLCRETCGACVDKCHDDEEAMITALGGVHSCEWLTLRPFLHTELCTIGSEAFEKCPETCNDANCESKVVPYSPNREELDKVEKCDDQDDAYFLVDSEEQGQYYENCVWLRGNSRFLSTVCVPTNPAFDICRETCGQCSDFCVDDKDAQFEFNGIIRSCAWLSPRLHLHETVCVEGSEIYTACGESCNNDLCETATEWWYYRDDKANLRLGQHRGGAGGGAMSVPLPVL